METESGPAVKPFFWKKTVFLGTRRTPPALRPAATEMTAADATEIAATAADVTEIVVTEADATEIAADATEVKYTKSP